MRVSGSRWQLRKSGGHRLRLYRLKSNREKETRIIYGAMTMSILHSSYFAGRSHIRT